MCGRFTLTWDEWRRVTSELGVDDGEAIAASYHPRLNIAPTDEHFIVTSEYERRKDPARTMGFSQSLGYR
jgi:putative SOS response-associated peptidase YedK